MTNNSIRAVIDSLNRKTAGDLVTTVALSGNVFLGKVWIQKPKPDDEIGQRPLPHTFYFIKNQEGLYIGAVLDMFHDLHWYVIPKYRKLGYLSQALSTKILPHLLIDRDSITISIDKNAIGEKYFIASKRVAFKVGFIEQSIKDGRHEYLLESSLYPKERNYKPEIPGIPEDRIKTLRKKIYFISRLLAIVQSEIEMNLGDPDYSENLREIVNQVYRQIWELEDSWSDRQ